MGQPCLWGARSVNKKTKKQIVDVYEQLWELGHNNTRNPDFCFTYLILYLLATDTI